MIEGSEQLGFALEPRNAVGILCELFGHYLDRYIPAEDLVFRLKDLPHPSPAELTGDLIMPERLADHEEPSRQPVHCNEKLVKKVRLF